MSRYTRVNTTIIIISITIASLLIGSTAATNKSASDVSQIESADINIEPGESIQEAINNAEVGDTVSISAGIYQQTININKTITLIGNGEVILDGNSLDDVNGISVTAEDVTIKNITVRRFDETGISISGDSILTRSVTIQNVTSRLNGASGLFVTAATDNSELTVENSEFEENGFKGINTDEEFNTIQVTDTATSQNNDGGMDLVGTTVEVQSANIFDNDGEGGFDDDHPQHGIDINEAKKVVIKDSIFKDNRGSNININADSSPLTSNVSIKNVTSKRNVPFEGSDYAGIFVASATEDDVISLTDVSVQESTFEGISVSAEEIQMIGIKSINNDDIGINAVGDIVNISNVRVTENNAEGGFDDDEAQHGIQISQANDVTIKNAILTDNRGSSINIAEDDSDNTPLNRNVNITNVTSKRNLQFEGNGYTGIFVESAIESDSINLTDISVRESSFYGISVNADDVSLNNVDSMNNDDTGIAITGTTVDIDDTKTTENNGEGGFDDDIPQHGISIGQAKNVQINNLISERNRGNNIKIGGDSDERPLTRSIKMHNVTSSRTLSFEDSDHAGIYIDNAVEEDEIALDNVVSTDSGFNGISLEVSDISNVTVENSEVTDNDNIGIYSEGDSINIQDSNISDNNNEAIVFSSVGSEITLTNSSVTGSSTLVRNDAEIEADARMNWWGAPTGPNEEAIEGLVDTRQPLSSPPKQSTNDDGGEASTDIEVTTEEVLISGSTISVSTGGANSISVSELPSDVSVSSDSGRYNPEEGSILWTDFSDGLSETVTFTLTPDDSYAAGDDITFTAGGTSVTLDVIETDLPSELAGDVSDSQYSAVAGSDNDLSAPDLSGAINQWSQSGSVNGVNVGAPELSRLINYWANN